MEMAQTKERLLNPHESTPKNGSPQVSFAHELWFEFSIISFSI
jgi:hypothetical protein